MEKDGIGTLIILKQKLVEYLQNDEIEKAKNVYDRIDEVMRKIGNISLDSLMTEEQKEKIEGLFKM